MPTRRDCLPARTSSFLLDADWQQQICRCREGGEIISGEPEGGFKEVGGKRGGVEEFGDGFARERWFGNFFKD